MAGYSRAWMASGDLHGEHETSANQKAAWANQAAANNATANANLAVSGVAHQRGLDQQEQSRRAYDSETARLQGTQKYGVLAGLMSQAQRWNA